MDWNWYHEPFDLEDDVETEDFYAYDIEQDYDHDYEPCSDLCGCVSCANKADQ